MQFHYEQYSQDAAKNAWADVLHFVILISGSKSVKFALKFRIFLKFLTLEGTLLTSGPCAHAKNGPCAPAGFTVLES